MVINNSKILFSQLISETARRSKFPARIMFELTYRCNFHCLHCYVFNNKKKKELSTSQIKKVLDQLKVAGCYHIGFTGGEVFLRQDIFEVLEYAKSCGFIISILTNGYLIDEKVAQKLSALGNSLNRVDVSVLGANEKTFEKITGVKGSYNRVIKAIRLLKQAGICVQIKATLLNLNKDEFLSIKRMAEELGVVFRYTLSLFARVDGNKNPLKYQVNSKRIVKIEKQLLDGNGIVDGYEQVVRRSGCIGRRNLFHCGAAQTEATISPYGELNFCMEIQYPQYSILKTSFQNCWKKLKKLVEDIRLPKEYLCSDCVLASFCHWCPAKAWALKRDFFTCDYKERLDAYEKAKNSTFWKDIAPIWEKQKYRFL
jgi:radical SAM protein with 4Fe4S-binding SPASM domain